MLRCVSAVSLPCLSFAPKSVVTCENIGMVTRTASLYDEAMIATQRDYEIVQLIGRFKQMTSGHVKVLKFATNNSATPCMKALKRLVDRGYLKYIERRLIGGGGGGSGQYVYQLGSHGWKLLGKEGKYWPYRSIDYHTLAIADMFVMVKLAERQGALQVVTYENEPDTWHEVAGVQLTPDLYLELDLIHKQQRLALWVEVDLGTERQSVLKDKFARYWHAYQNTELEVFSLVLFITPDEQRTYDLTRWLKQGESEQQNLFIVTENNRFSGLFV